MSCDNRCYDKEDKYYGHESCDTCPGRDDGSTRETLMSIPAACPLKDEQDLTYALGLLQEYLEEGAKLSYGSQTKRLALVQDANIIIYGKTIRDLLENLLKIGDATRFVD